MDRTNLNDLSNGEKLILYYFYEIHKALKKSNSWQYDYQFIKNLNDNLYLPFHDGVGLKKRIDLKTVLMEGHALAVADGRSTMIPEDNMYKIDEFFEVLFHDLGLYTKYTFDEYKYPERAGELNNKWKNTSNPLREYIVQWYWTGLPRFGTSISPSTLHHNYKMFRYLHFFENIKLHKIYHTEFVLELEKNIEQIQKSEFKRIHQDRLRKSEENRIRKAEEILWKGQNTNIKTNKKRNNRSNNSKSRNNKKSKKNRENNSKSRNNKNGKNNRSNNPKSRNNQKSKKNKKH